MQIKYTNHYLHKLEEIFAESDYILRYEKGNFKAGYCILDDKKIAVINKYFSIEGKINCLIEILKSIDIEKNSLSEKSRKYFLELKQTELEL